MMNLLALDLTKTEVVGDLVIWAIILSGLGLLGILWVVQLIYKLARNQVRLAGMIQELSKQRRP